MNAAKCGLGGMTYTIRYCPDQDVINLQITAPLAGNVVMRRSGCSGVLLEESQVIAEPVLPSPMGLRPPSWVQDLLKASTQAGLHAGAGFLKSSWVLAWHKLSHSMSQRRR